ncbi:MAG: C45 family autoproteolytic acyltransferase/hydrolase [Mycolicibacterium sp.]|uniref:C45 family autoproteolytic acyltransferase/hydolase n=1 Tax=Mycolicibacterium sp. TaxID=2320850 RepID=UPI003D0C38A0
MNTVCVSDAHPHLPAPDSHWRVWVVYGLAWASARRWAADAADPAVVGGGRFLTLHAYREAEPGPRWRALYDATWPAYRRWYTREGLAVRPSLRECRDALIRYLPELVPTWERLCRLSRNDSVAARMLSMWRMPAFAVGCSQAVLPGEQPALVRNYDYDPSLFEAVIASTDYSRRRRVLGTSDMLWGLLDGMNEDGLAVSLAFGGRPDVGAGFGIPIVLRYVLETCATVEQAVGALRRIPVSQSYNVALVDIAGEHATVFVAPGQPAEVSGLHATTNHRLDQVEHHAHAARFNSAGRRARLEEVRAGEPTSRKLVAAMLAPPMRNDQFELGFGTLYTAEYRPAAGVATWHWPETYWSRGFDDTDEVRKISLA